MSENLRNYVKSVYAFDHVLKCADAKGLDKALKKKAPVDGWTATDVYEHCVGGVKMVHAWAATGKGPKSGVKLGKQPMAAWEKIRDSTLEALDHDGVLHALCEPFGPDMGPMPMDVFVGFRGAELAVHTWDFARATRVDERLDPGLVKFTHAMWKQLPEDVLRMDNMLGAPVKPAQANDAQTRMLNFVGRTV
jgi:uncharacterized protein (TIGR03086 family)